MALNRREIGRNGESAAENYLRERGYQILAKNFQCGHKEIDLICRDGEYIVFVEVKARSSTEYGLPAECITFRKQQMLRMAAQMFLKKNGMPDAFCRFDAVEVFLSDGRIHHIENAF